MPSTLSLRNKINVLNRIKHVSVTCQIGSLFGFTTRGKSRSLCAPWSKLVQRTINNCTVGNILFMPLMVIILLGTQQTWISTTLNSFRYIFVRHCTWYRDLYHGGATSKIRARAICASLRAHPPFSYFRVSKCCVHWKLQVKCLPDQPILKTEECEDILTLFSY